MIASLPMYARPELQDAHDALWALIRDGLRDVGLPAPDALDHSAGTWQAWQDPDLVFSQTCNYPYRARLHGKVTLIGAGDYGLPGTDPGTYYSVFVARADDPRSHTAQFSGAPFAYNEPLSQSGWAAPQLWAANHGITLPPVLQTGAHRASAEAVAAGQADIAALDAVTWRLMQRYDDWTDQLKVVGRTDASPALSFITRAGQDPVPYCHALRGALAALPDTHAQDLGLLGIVPIPAAAYLALPTPDSPKT